MKDNAVRIDPAVPVIQTEHLYFAYDRLPILEEVNMTVNHLDSICIVGPNGGGKTTLLKIILGLLKPDRGSIKVFGRSPQEGRDRIGYVPQHANYDPQFPVTVFDVILMGRLGKIAAGPYSGADKEAAGMALEQMGLQDYAHMLFSDISGGQRQRALIARALASGGELLLLDEPTSNIDKETEVHLFEILKTLNQRMTIMLVTHDVGFASTFFKSVACINRKVFIHPTSELTGHLIQDTYGGEIRMIRHDLRCGIDEHFHD
jgi:zinc transport system ATP-binding protein